MADELHIHVLGGLRITQGDTPLTGFVSSKAPALLAYLAVTGRPHFRSALAALLWSDLGETAARMNLRHVLANLRQLVAPHLTITRDTITFDRTSPYWLDVEQVEAALTGSAEPDPQRLHAAVALYRGDFLAGFYVRDALEFEEWVAAQRERLHQVALHALHTLATVYTARHEYMAAIDASTRLLVLEPWREESYRQLMLLLAQTGQRSAALAQYATCQRVLEAELGVEPDAETTALYQRIRAGEIAVVEPPARVPDGAPGDAGALVPMYTLPVPPTSLVGRMTELAQVSAYLVNPAIRLVTLLGPGGVGKTRLALEAAAQQREIFKDGVVFIDLAPLRDPALVAATIAQTLGVRETTEQPVLETLITALREQQLLLLLDNFEHLLPAATTVSALLAHCPQLMVLVTSRAVLHVRGEQEFPVPPLTVPDPPHLPYTGERAASLARYSAVELFMARATDVNPTFAVSDENALSITEICRRLDGLPLAIELAAARVKLFSPQALLARLHPGGTRLALLTGGARDLPARQQTLRDTIAWSHDLLPTDEQALFRRLAVFAGGCTLEAAEAICPADEGMPLDVMNGIASLVDKSLLRRTDGTGLQGDPEPRFVMLETIREYALERLEASGETEAIRQQQACFFLQYAEAAEPTLFGPDQIARLLHLEAEHDNLRAALEWSQEIGEIEVGLRLAGALAHFWWRRGHLREGRQRLESVLASARTLCPAHDVAWAKALFGAGLLAGHQGDRVVARSLLEESIARWRELTASSGEGAARRAKQGLAYALAELGRMGREIVRDLAWVDACFDEALALYSEIDDPWGIAHVLTYQATFIVQDQGDYATARALHEESLAIHRRLENPWGVAIALIDLGEVARCQNDHDRAAQLYTECLALFNEMRDEWYIAGALHNLGYVAHHQGDAARAASLFAESLTQHGRLGNKRGIAECLAGLSGVAGAQRQPERGARLIGAAAALLERLGAHLDHSDQREYDRNVAAIRAQLDQDEWTAAWTAGRTMPLEQAIVYALEAVSVERAYGTYKVVSNSPM